MVRSLAPFVPPSESVGPRLHVRKGPYLFNNAPTVVRLGDALDVRVNEVDYVVTPFEFRRIFLGKRHLESGSARRRKLITVAFDASIVLGGLVLGALLFGLINHFTSERPEQVSDMNMKHLSASELKALVNSSYNWKVFWAGSRDSKEFILQTLTEGVIRIIYVNPDGKDVPTVDSFIVYSGRSEADRANIYHRIDALSETTLMTPKGRTIVFDKNSLIGERIYLPNGNAGIQFPSLQSVKELKSAADSLVPIN